MMNIYYHITESRHGDLVQSERFIVMPKVSREVPLPTQ